MMTENAPEHSHNTAAPGKIFIVDDEPMVTFSVKTMLELETDHTIYAFNNPNEALTKIASLSPDIVISDFSMPEMDGISFLQEVKKMLPESTLILLTGYADKESAIQAINRVGIYRYIEKPWDNDELKLSIKNGLERSRLLGDLRSTIQELKTAQNQLQSYNEELERLVAERTQDLQVAYQTLNSIIEHTADGIITLNPQCCITSINPAVQKWLSKEKNTESLVGSPVGEALAFPHTKRSTRELFSPENPHILEEGFIGETPVEVSISPIPEKGGYILVLRDIIQRKEVERLRDDFISTLTHDLRTPLLAAIQTLGFFTDGSLGSLTPKQSEILTMLIQSLREMLGLVNVLLEVYKYESGRQRLIFGQVNVGDLLTTVGKELESLAKNKQQELSVEIPDNLPSIYGDKQELRRVFVNLMGNALNFTPAGGKIGVFVELKDHSVTVCVEDNGRGIPAQDIPLLFQRFSQGTSKQRSSGTGLGLYLSRQIVEAHHGSIWVESTEGKGSRFSLTLPLRQKRD